ncbi:MAG: NAD(+)/NADH kinase [Bryobacteraceae bacterium]
MPGIKCVGIFSKPSVPVAATLVPRLVVFLRERGLKLLLDDITARHANGYPAMAREEIARDCDFIIVLGGDGTLLSAARAVAGKPTPIFAVNLGGLGFLTAITVDEVLPELERALRDEHRIALRKMLHTDLVRNGETVASYEALNDAVVTKAGLARMIDVEIFIDKHYVSTYKADGVIVATPTGSTAYSLSAGGPIIYPSVSAYCLTPICPHMLTNRPVIVPETSVIRMTSLNKDDEAYLTIDGQVGETLKQNDMIVCRASDYAVHLVRPPRMLFFDVLRSKLKWGER